MKRIKLWEKKATVRMSPVQTEQEVELKSINFLTSALELNLENTKGIDRMIRISGILDKITRQARDGDSLIVEDSDYQVIKDSVDKTQWNFLILHFPEFLDSIANPEKMSDTKGG